MRGKHCFVVNENINEKIISLEISTPRIGQFFSSEIIGVLCEVMTFFFVKLNRIITTI